MKERNYDLQNKSGVYTLMYMGIYLLMGYK